MIDGYLTSNKPDIRWYHFQTYLGIMLSSIVSAFFQDILKERFRAFGLWLYWSEIAAAILFAILTIREPVIIPAGFLLYALFSWSLLSRYKRTQAKLRGEAVPPPARVLTPALIATVLFLALLLAAILTGVIQISRVHDESDTETNTMVVPNIF